MKLFLVTELWTNKISIFSLSKMIIILFTILGSLNAFATCDYIKASSGDKDKLINSINNNFYEYRINRNALISLEYLRLHQKNLSNTQIENQKAEYVKQRNYYHDHLFADMISIRHIASSQQFEEITNFMRWDDSYAMKTIDYLPSDDDYQNKQLHLIKCLTNVKLCNI